MTKRERQILTYLRATDEQRAKNQYSPCEFADKGFEVPTANEIKHFLVGLSVAELKRFSQGHDGQRFNESANAALASLVPKRVAKVHRVQVSLGSSEDK